MKHKGQHNTADQRGQQGSMDRIVNHFIVPAAQTMGNGHAGTHRQSYEEVDHQIGDGTGGTNGGNADAAAEAAYDHQVCRIEQQLQDAGADNGDGIQDDIEKQRAFQHILIQTFHEDTFFYSIDYLHYRLFHRKCKRVPAAN